MLWKKTTTIILDLLTTLLIVVAVVLLARPTGPLRSILVSWRTDRHTQEVAERSWKDLPSFATVLGREAAAGEIIEVGDYECPFCRSNQAAVDSLIQQKVRVWFVHFPLPIHANARRAALAVLCGEQFGASELLHRQLMTDTAWKSDGGGVRTAVAAGILDTLNFSNCLLSESTEQRLAQNEAIVQQLKVTGTPTFIGRNGVLRGLASTDQLLALTR